MYLLVGLGNPGPKYCANRHNIGFMVIDRIADDQNASFREKFKGLVSKTVVGGDDIVLLKPMTFMNLSGESVQKAMKFYKIPLDHVIVVHDELDLDEGIVRIKVGGGTAGHNGLKSIIQHGGGKDFTRIRFGVGRPRSGPTAGFVLSDFNVDERATLPDHINEAAKMALGVVKHGPILAMNRFNRR